jgi:hypothetical protein
MNAADDEYVQLEEISRLLSHEYVSDGDDPWEGSPFKWILSKPSRTKGAIGEKIVARWADAHGAVVGRSDDSEADRVLNGKRVEIKMSTLWETGIYMFQQVRDQDYEYLVALGLSPSAVHCWVISKQQLLDHVIGKTGQHTGNAGQDTAWISVDVLNPPSWMADCGGTLDQAWEIIEAWPS